MNLQLLHPVSLKKAYFSDHLPPAGFRCSFNRLQHETDYIVYKIKEQAKNYSFISGVYEYPISKKYSLPITHSP